jgi:hypothetical protein
MADGKKADIGGDVLRAVKKEDHSGEEEKMVVARHHVLGPKVDEGDGAKTRHLLHIARVSFGDVVGKGGTCAKRGKKCEADGPEQWPISRWTPLRPKMSCHV